MEYGSAHHLYQIAHSSLGEEAATDLSIYAQRLTSSQLPVIFTLGHLAYIAGVRYQTLYQSVARKREASNYRLFNVRKRSGGLRPVHAVATELSRVQRFVNEQVLQSARCAPHPASYAFHPAGGIRRCAEQHCGARWLFRYDLEDFFFRVDEVDVFKIFKGLGYRPLLAFELARLCTTTMLSDPLKERYCRLDRSRGITDRIWRLYNSSGHRLGVLPQGAASSPMLANLACRSLDTKLAAVAEKNGMVCTRYADDITLSCGRDLDLQRDVPQLHRAVRLAIASEGFSLNTRKTRISGPGARKTVLGLLVDGHLPRLTRQTRKRIDRLLYSCEAHGLFETAQHERFDTVAGFYHHLRGLTAYAADVDPHHGRGFLSRFRSLKIGDDTGIGIMYGPLKGIEKND